MVDHIHAELALQNTVAEICQELDALLDALNSAISQSASGGVVVFVTNVSSLDGIACANNVCPQCDDRTNAVFTADQGLDSNPVFTVDPYQQPPVTTTTEAIALLETMTTSPMRRLLSSDVTVVVVSQPSAPVVVASMPTDQLTALLQAGLSATALNAGVSGVSVAVVEMPVAVKRPWWEEYSDLLAAFVACTFIMLVMVVFIGVRLDGRRRPKKNCRNPRQTHGG